MMKGLLKLNRILLVECEMEMPDAHEACDQQKLSLISLLFIRTRIGSHTWD